MFKNKLNMNLQFFAEPGGNQGGEGGEGGEPLTIPDKYNDAVNAIVKKSNSKYLKQIDGLNAKISDLDNKLDEAQTKGMNGEQKNTYQIDKLQKQLEESQQTNQALQAQITKGNLTNKVIEMAKKDGLNIDKDQLSLIVGADEDTTIKQYDVFKSFAKTQEESLKKQFGSVPNSNVHSDNNHFKASVNTALTKGFKLSDIK